MKTDYLKFIFWDYEQDFSDLSAALKDISYSKLFASAYQATFLHKTKKSASRYFRWVLLGFLFIPLVNLCRCCFELSFLALSKIILKTEYHLRDREQHWYVWLAHVGCWIGYVLSRCLHLFFRNLFAPHKSIQAVREKFSGKTGNFFAVISAIIFLFSWGVFSACIGFQFFNAVDGIGSFVKTSAKWIVDDALSYVNTKVTAPLFSDISLKIADGLSQSITLGACTMCVILLCIVFVMVVSFGIDWVEGKVSGVGEEVFVDYENDVEENIEDQQPIEGRNSRYIAAMLSRKSPLEDKTKKQESKHVGEIAVQFSEKIKLLHRPIPRIDVEDESVSEEDVSESDDESDESEHTSSYHM